jgi:hypothetical protein
MLSSVARIGIPILLGFALCVGDLQAKSGTRSYSTDSAEVVVARERLAIARAKAQSEAAVNPLARLFGSQAQTDAKAAEAQLQEVPARPRTSSDSSRNREAGPLVKSTKKVAVSSATPTRRRIESTAPGVAGRRSTKKAPATSTAPERPQVVRQTKKEPASTGSTTHNYARPSSRVRRPASPAAPAIEEIVFDFASGIKTVHMTDGTIQEDLFDPAMAASLKRAAPSGARISFVNEPVAGPTSRHRNSGKLAM